MGARDMHIEALMLELQAAPATQRPIVSTAPEPPAPTPYPPADTPDPPVPRTPPPVTPPPQSPIPM